MNVNQAAAEAARLSKTGEGYASIGIRVAPEGGVSYELFHVQIDEKGYNSFEGFDQ